MYMYPPLHDRISQLRLDCVVFVRFLFAGKRQLRVQKCAGSRRYLQLSCPFNSSGFTDLLHIRLKIGCSTNLLALFSRQVQAVFLLKRSWYFPLYTLKVVILILVNNYFQNLEFATNL